MCGQLLAQVLRQEGVRPKALALLWPAVASSTRVRHRLLLSAQRYRSSDLADPFNSIKLLASCLWPRDGRAGMRFFGAPYAVESLLIVWETRDSGQGAFQGFLRKVFNSLPALAAVVICSLLARNI